MSTIAEKAREEADRVEADELAALEASASGADPGEVAPADESAGDDAEGDAGEGGAGDGQPQPSPTAPAPPDEPAAFVVDEKALEKELKRHDKAMAGVFGPEWEAMEACGTCGGMGAVPPDFVPVPEMLEDPDALVCGACNGYGSRLTPSLVQQYMTEQCGKCLGKGWRTRAEVEAELESLRIQGELAQPAPQDGPHWNAALGVWEGANVAPPPQPQLVYNPATGQWEIPAGYGAPAQGVSYGAPPQG